MDRIGHHGHREMSVQEIPRPRIKTRIGADAVGMARCQPAGTQVNDEAPLLKKLVNDEPWRSVPTSQAMQPFGRKLQGPSVPIVSDDEAPLVNVVAKVKHKPLRIGPPPPYAAEKSKMPLHNLHIIVSDDEPLAQATLKPNCKSVRLRPKPLR